MAAPRILILRTSALGDVVHVLPVLTALRRQLPEARLGWVVEEAMAPVLEGHPDLDELLVVGLRPWRRRPLARRTLAEVTRFVQALRRFAPDVALDLMGNHKAGVLARLSGARRRIGPARPWRREPSSAIWINEGYEPQGTHVVDRALSVLAALGLPPAAADFGGERLFAAGRAAAAPPQGYALIHPGAGWGNKVYPPEGWGEVARGLHAAAHIAVRVAVAPGEEELAVRVVAAAAGAAETTPAPDLPSLATLSRGARLVLAGDTGPLHLAHALGVPVLGVMGPTDPARHGPYGAPERTLAVRLPCSFCYRRMAEAKACLLTIPPRHVVERAVALLAVAPAA